jgi:hypothetical protein
MIDALISGRLASTPQRRTSTKDRTYVIGKMRAAMVDRSDRNLSKSVVVHFITFIPSEVEALLALNEGDSLTVSGELTADVYPASDGTLKMGLDLLVHKVLTAYHVGCRRKAIHGEASETA